MTDMNNLLREMIRAALLGAERIMEIYESDYEVYLKEDSSPLTAADIASNNAVTAHLRKYFSEASILSEEDADSSERLTNKNGVFILDPLDGTMEFINCNGEFCVSLGFAQNSRVVAGVIAVPVKREIFYACENMGAYKIGVCDFSDDFVIGTGKRLRVSDRREKIIITVSRSHMDSQTKALLERNRDRIGGTIMVGSCLKGCYIAEGIADVHYRWGEFTKEWDTAAMQIICEESGAIFTDVYGDPIPANRTDPTNRRGFRILNHAESSLDSDGIV